MGWNRNEWDLSNIDIYHTLRESNDIYQYGAKALGREFSFLERNKGTTKKEFSDAFQKVSVTAEEMKCLIGDWNDTETMLKNFGSRSIREKIGQLIDACQREDRRAYEQLNLLYQRYFSSK